MTSRIGLDAACIIFAEGFAGLLEENKEFVFIPDGYHVMLVGLKQDLHEGDEIEIVLHFRDHEDMTIRVPVGEAVEHEH